MAARETTWDEEDDTSKSPLLPGINHSEFERDAAMNAFIKRIYEEGVSSQIIEMCEERKPIGRQVIRLPAIRREGDKLIVPVVAEKMVLVKRTILIEEIVLSPIMAGTDDECDD